MAPAGFIAMMHGAGSLDVASPRSQEPESGRWGSTSDWAKARTLRLPYLRHMALTQDPEVPGPSIQL